VQSLMQVQFCLISSVELEGLMLEGFGLLIATFYGFSFFFFQIPDIS